MTFTSLNETAKLEWLDPKKMTIRFEYSNRFYGSCRFKARLEKRLPSWTLNKNSLLLENYENLRIEPQALLDLSTTCLRRILLKFQTPDLSCFETSGRLG